jgi:fatty acid elongase 3
MVISPSEVFPPFNEYFSPIIPITVVGYFTVIGILWFVMRGRKPLELTGILAVHNFLLCAFSLVCFLGQLYEAISMYTNFGLYQVYCGTFDDDWDIRMARWGIAFYLSKYYELFDTVFVVIRKKPLTVLHLFHHALVIPISWMAVNSRIYMGWITAFNNTGVHVFMYYYFAVYALGQRPWWKRYLTKLQIFQFIMDMGTSLPFIVIYLLGYPCRGELYAWVIANFAGLALLLLFNNFYATTYTPATPRVADTTHKKSS